MGLAYLYSWSVRIGRTFSRHVGKLPIDCTIGPVVAMRSLLYALEDIEMWTVATSQENLSTGEEEYRGFSTKNAHVSSKSEHWQNTPIESSGGVGSSNWCKTSTIYVIHLM